MLDLDTRTLYIVAAGLNLTLGLTSLVFSYLQPGTLAMRHWALGILMTRSEEHTSELQSQR